jgi:hypothetical protein
MSEFDIRIARDDVDRAHAYRLRYELYDRPTGSRSSRPSSSST